MKPGPASSVEEYWLCNILASSDRSSNPAVHQDLFTVNLLPIMRDIELLKNVANLKIQENEEQLL